jgi:hypothetical protein
MPPPGGCRLEAGRYSPSSNNSRAWVSGPRRSKMHLVQNEDATLDGLGTERRAIRKLADARRVMGTYLADAFIPLYESATRSEVGVRVKNVAGAEGRYRQECGRRRSEASAPGRDGSPDPGAFMGPNTR